MIDAFNLLRRSGWRLVLAGGVLHGSDEVKRLKNMVGNTNVEFVINPDWKKLEDLFARAPIYWHAAGYGQNLEKYPERAEHFGISTVEAMSAGAVPLVFEGGGLPEIIEHGGSGFLWKDVDDLVNQTNELLDNKKILMDMDKAAKKRAEKFSLEVFEREFKKIIS